MAEFQRGLSEIPSISAPTQGVESSSSAAVTSGITNIAGSIGNIFSGMAEQQQKAQKNKALSDYSNQVANIASAVDQGMPSGQAMSHIRALYKTAVSNNPSLTAQITSLTGQMVNTKGIANIAVTGNEEERARIKEEDAALKDGYLRRGMSDEEKEAGVIRHQESVFAIKEVQRQQAELNLKKSRGEEITRLDKAKGEKALITLSGTQWEPFNNSIKDIEDDLRVTNDVEAANAAIDKLSIENESLFSRVGVGASKEFVDGLAKIYRDSITNVKKRVSGELSAKAYANRNKVLKEKAKAAILGDERLLRATVALDLFSKNPEASLVISHRIQDSLLDYILNGADDSVSIIKPKSNGDEKKGRESVNDYFKLLKGGMDVQATGPQKTIEQTQEEFTAAQEDVAKRVDMVFDSLNDGKQSDKPNDYNNIMDFLASPEYSKYSKMENFQLPPEKLKQAQEILNRQYKDKLMPTIRDEFRNSKVYSDEFDTSGTAVPMLKTVGTPGNVKVTFSGNGVSFQPALNLSSDLVGGAQTEADRLNAKVAPLLNRWIAVASNLSGEDPKVFWEQGLAKELFTEVDVGKSLGSPEKSTGGQKEVEGTITPLERLPQPEDARKEFDIQSRARQAMKDSKELPEDVRKFFDELMARQEEESTVAPEKHSELWGKLFQGEDSAAKKKSFLSHQDIDLEDGVEEAIDTALSVFKGDNGVNDQSVLREVLIGTAKHESKGGKILEQGSGGPARGAFQNEPKTVKDIIKNSGLIGPSAEKILGRTKEEILAMSPDELNEYLKDHKVSAVFATAKYLQAAKAKGLISEFDKGEG